MCNKRTVNSILAAVIIILALAVAVAASVWHQQGLPYIMFVSRFFDFMIPILAVGGLIKYLLTGCGCTCCHKHEEETSKQ